jgi:hypothetical protein
MVLFVKRILRGHSGIPGLPWFVLDLVCRFRNDGMGRNALSPGRQRYATDQNLFQLDFSLQQEDLVARFVVRLHCAAPFTADDRIACTGRAFPRMTLSQAAAQLLSGSCSRLESGIKQTRNALGLCAVLTCPDLSRRRSKLRHP